MIQSQFWVLSEDSKQKKPCFLSSQRTGSSRMVIMKCSDYQQEAYRVNDFHASEWAYVIQKEYLVDHILKQEQLIYLENRFSRFGPSSFRGSSTTMTPTHPHCTERTSHLQNRVIFGFNSSVRFCNSLFHKHFRVTFQRLVRSRKLLSTGHSACSVTFAGLLFGWIYLSWKFLFPFSLDFRAQAMNRGKRKQRAPLLH